MQTNVYFFRAYDAIIKDCQQHGQFDYTTTGHVSNVGLMAKKAEEYGSHDKTFEIQHRGTIIVTDDSDAVIFKHPVEVGDIWRMCQVPPLPRLSGSLPISPSKIFLAE